MDEASSVLCYKRILIKLKSEVYNTFNKAICNNIYKGDNGIYLLNLIYDD